MYNELQIGDVFMWNAIESLDVWRTRHAPTDLVQLTVKKSVSLDHEIEVPVNLRLGYTVGTLSPVFVGRASKSEGRFLEAKDAIRNLVKTKVSQTLLNVTPQEIARFLFAEAGIRDPILTDTSFSKREQFILARMDGYSAMERINRLWGIEILPYIDVQGIPHWTETPDPPEEMPSFEYGKNILDLEVEDDRARLLTIGVPFIDHSSWIAISHPRVTINEALVHTVHHFTTEQGALRTELFFKVG